jgi:hypothetical protein
LRLLRKTNKVTGAGTTIALEVKRWAELQPELESAFRSGGRQRKRCGPRGSLLPEQAGAEAAFQRRRPGWRFSLAVRLMLDRAEKPEFDHPGSVLYFAVPDIQAAYEKLREGRSALRG